VVIRQGDRVRCSPRCDPPHFTDSIGIVAEVRNMIWPIKVEWLDGEWSFYDEYELEVCEP
jgi:hypothetical protein